MTFSQSVKAWILKSVRNVKSCCATAFLTAVVKSVGSLTIGRGGYGFSVESDNEEFLGLLSNLAQEHLDEESKTEAYNLSAKGTAVYSCRFDASMGEKLGIVLRDADGALELAPAETLLPTKHCCKKAFLQGLFVSCGSVVIPHPDDVGTSDNARYHLELRFSDGEFARAVEAAYSDLGFRATARKNHTVLYLKDSESISDLLVYVNATSAKFELENIRVMRSIRNDANRQSNCTVANIEKAVAAAARQLEAIALLRKKGLFDTLPDNLREIALAREEYPEATLEEIAARLHISKSGASHRFAKLSEIAFD